MVHERPAPRRACETLARLARLVLDVLALGGTSRTWLAWGARTGENRLGRAEMTIAVLGGTGPEGLGLAARLAAAGHEVVVGSRLTERAVAAAATLGPEVPAGRVRGAVNCDAAEAAEILVVAVPLKGLGDLFAACATAVEGKIVLEVVNALRVEAGVFRAVHPEEGSVGARIAARVPSARVVSGLKHVSAANL